MANEHSTNDVLQTQPRVNDLYATSPQFIESRMVQLLEGSLRKTMGQAGQYVGRCWHMGVGQSLHCKVSFMAGNASMLPSLRRRFRQV